MKIITMEPEYLKKTINTIFLVFLIVLSFMILKPILMAIVIAMILAFVFSPIFDKLYKWTKSKNLSASIIVVILILAIILPLWFLTPILIEQSFKFFFVIKDIDFVGPLKTIFPSFFASEAFSQEVGTILNSFVLNTTNQVVNILSQVILNFPTVLLQLLVVFFTFFFVLRDKDILISYLQGLLPFSKEVEKKLFDQTKGITASVLYGQIVVGLFQGAIVALSFFIFRVPNELFLSSLAIILGVIPIVGQLIVWVPVTIYLLISGNNTAAIGVLIFGLFSSTIDNFIRPMIVSKRTQLHSGVIFIGMIGGIFYFGILGLILGPLILAYLLIIVEIYRDKKTPGLFNPEENKSS